MMCGKSLAHLFIIVAADATSTQGTTKLSSYVSCRKDSLQTEYKPLERIK